MLSVAAGGLVVQTGSGDREQTLVELVFVTDAVVLL